MSSHKPIRTALLSYGMSGEIFHAPLLTAHSQFELACILERTRDRARLRYPGAAIVRSLDDVLQDETVELVVVNTPHDTHAGLTARVLEAGKHAIVEKPFTVTTDEGRQLAALARQKGLVLSVFQNRRWDGDFMTVQQVMNANVLGRIVEFEAHYDRYRPAVDHHTWKETAHAGSGILYNLGAHMIDQALVLFGMPRFVDARVGIQRTGGVTDDFYDIRMAYDGVQVILKSSYLVREPGPRYIIHGEGGSFVKYGLDPQEQALKDGIMPGAAGWGVEPAEWWGKLTGTVNQLDVEGRIRTLPGNYAAFYDTIYGAIREGREPGVTAAQGLQVVRLIELVIQSSREKKALPVERL